MEIPILLFMCKEQWFGKDKERAYERFAYWKKKSECGKGVRRVIR